MRIPKTPIEFDYDLWTTEDGKCMVRVKATKEECEVSREAFRLLRAEEKRLRRSMTGVPASECVQETATLLSLDYVSCEGGEDMSPAWLEDRSNDENSMIVKLMESEFIKTLTPFQYRVYTECLSTGKSVLAYSKELGCAYSTVKEAKYAIQKKFKKFFECTR